MGKKRITSYTFDASAKTITFSGPLDVEGFSVITNVVDNIIVYQFNDPLLGGTFATNTLTLTYDTASMSDTDELMILYDDGVETTTVDGTVTANAGTDLNTSALALEAGGNLAAIKTNTDDIETLLTTIEGNQLPDGHNVTVDNASIAVTADSLPLPTGAATEAKQDAIIANLPINEVGRLKTSNLPADITPVTGTITGNAQTIAFPTDRVSNVMAHCYGTFSTINCTFEGSLNSTNGSDGNWFTIQAARTSTNTIETTTGNLSAAPAYGWELSVNALRYMRVRSTAFTSGTQSWVFTLGSYATEPIPAIQAHAVTLAAAATAIAKAEDSASASANVGVPPMIVRADSLPANAGTSADGDYAFAFCDNTGRIYNNSKVTESVLPTGASTEAKQDTIITHVDGVEDLLTTIDADTGAIKTAVETIDNAIAGSEMQVDVVSMPTTTVQATNLDVRDLVQTSDAVAVYGSDDGGTTKRIIKTDAGGAIQVDLEVENVTVNNEGGASAVNIQDGGNSITIDGGVTANAGTNLNTSALALEAGGNLAAIKAKTDNIPALGQALAAASVPVILPADTITTLTPPAAITGFATSAKQDTIITHIDGIEGSVDGIEGLLTTIDGDTGNIATSTALLDDTVYTDGAGTPSKGLLVLGSDDTNPQALSTDSSGNLQVEVLSAPTTAVTGTFWQATQPVSGTVTANLSATDNAVLDDIAANQTDGTQKTQLIDAGGEAVTITGGKLDVNASIDTTGLATSAKQDDIITAIGDIPGGGGVQYVEDDAAAANPTGTAINLIRADTPDAVTTTDGDNLSARGTNKGELYVKHIDAIPVTDNGGALTVDGTVAVTNAGITTIAGAVAGTEMQVDVLTLPSITGTVTANAGTNLNTSTLALETGGNLAAIKAKTDNIPALGQALAAASVPVILPAATITTLTPPAAITGFATSAKQDTIIGHVDGIEGLLTTIDADTGTIAGKDFATQTTLAAMNAKMVTGTDIGDVTINNSTGAAAVNIQDGGNSITVDGSLTVDLGANNDVTVTSGAITETNSGAIKTAVELIDNAIAGTEMQVDVVGALPAGAAIIGKVGHDITGIGHGVKVVTTAGTDVALAASTACKKVDLQAQTDNTGLIAIGGSGVDATVATGTGILLSAGDTYSLEIDDLADLYIDSTVNGEGVRFIYYT